MFEGAVAGLLNRLLGKYVEDLDTENLNVGIFSGSVDLTDLKLKPEALYELDLPIEVRIGTIGRINLQIPWAGLTSQPVVVRVEDVLVLAGPATPGDQDRERRLARASKSKLLEDLDADGEFLNGSQFFERLFTAIINNIQIYVSNVHVRYEDSACSRDSAMACGLCLQSLSIETTNSKWKPSVTPAGASTVYQLCRLEALSLYWNPEATALEERAATITPMQYYSWKQRMLVGLHKFTMHQEDFQFLLKPVAFKIKALVSRAGAAGAGAAGGGGRSARVLVDAVVPDAALALTREQYRSAVDLVESFQRIALNRKYWHIRPSTEPGDPGWVSPWWRYAFQAVKEQRIRPYTFVGRASFAEAETRARGAAAAALAKPHDAEAKLDLMRAQDALTPLGVMLAHHRARLDLLTDDPPKAAIDRAKPPWWGGPPRPRLTTVAAGSAGGLWPHLAAAERARLAALLGYDAAAGPVPPVEYKVNVTLGHCSLSLAARGRELALAALSHLLLSLETRPATHAFKISCRVEKVSVEGLGPDQELVPLLACVPAGTARAPLLALDLERAAGPADPAGSDPAEGEVGPAEAPAEFSLTCTLQPLEVVYVESAFSEVINMFESRAGRWAAAAAARGAGAAAHTAYAAFAACAACERPLVHLNLDFAGISVLLPEGGRLDESFGVVCVEASQVRVRSEVQARRAAPDDATCMELEERLYDRLHAGADLQVVFGRGAALCSARRRGESALHVVPSSRLQLVYSSSIEPAYRPLPRYKLNVSLSNLKLNVSESRVEEMCDWWETIHAPITSNPTAVPTVPTEFQLDRMPLEPSRRALLRLRDRILAAYLSRTLAKACSPMVAAQSPCGSAAAALSDYSDEDMEVYARSVDLPGFDDNVSPSNRIETLMRFVVGSAALTISSESAASITASAVRCSADVALMTFGPAAQLAVARLRLARGGRAVVDAGGDDGDAVAVLYRKVLASCPEFRSYFHSVERALVADAGRVAVTARVTDLRALAKTRDDLATLLSQRCSGLGAACAGAGRRARELWARLARPDQDPPVPSGATKFSYSVRASEITIRVENDGCDEDADDSSDKDTDGEDGEEGGKGEGEAGGGEAVLRLAGLSGDFVFRANDRLTLRLELAALQLDDLTADTLYPKLAWPEESTVLEVRLVRSAPRYGAGGAAGAAGPSGASGSSGTSGVVGAGGELRVTLSRLHLVLVTQRLLRVQQLISAGAGELLGAAAAAAAAAAAERLSQLRAGSERLHLAIEIHAPVLLLPQKPTSPNLLVFNMGDLVIENFFKASAEGPPLDNILATLSNVTLSRAVATLAGALRVQEPILEPFVVRCDIKRSLGAAAAGAARVSGGAVADHLRILLGPRDLSAILAVANENLREARHLWRPWRLWAAAEPPPADAEVEKLQEFLAQGDQGRKELSFRLTVEGATLQLFSDVDEALSSPVREPSLALARLVAGEAGCWVSARAGGAADLRAELQSLQLDDLRPTANANVKRVLRSSGGSTHSAGAVSVRQPALLEVSARVRGRALHVDARADRTRLDLAPPFVAVLVKTLLDAVPSSTGSGGVVNPGYEGYPAAPIPTGSSDGRDGHEPWSVSVSGAWRRPAVAVWTRDGEKPALFVQGEVQLEYSRHLGGATLVVSVGGLRAAAAARPALRRCDAEYSRVTANGQTKAKLLLPEVSLHVAAATLHAINDLADELSSALTPLETEDPPPEEFPDADLWQARPMTEEVSDWREARAAEGSEGGAEGESFTLSVPSVELIAELELATRVPVLIVKSRCEVTIRDWSAAPRGSGTLSLQASVYNERLRVWEPLVESVPTGPGRSRPWELSITIDQIPAAAMPWAAETSPLTRPAPRPRTPAPAAGDSDSDSETTVVRGARVQPAVVPAAADSDSDAPKTRALHHLLFDDETSDSDSDDSSSAPGSDDGAAEGRGGEKRSVSRCSESTSDESWCEGPGGATGAGSAGGAVDAMDGPRCTRVAITATDPLELTLTSSGIRALSSLWHAASSRAMAPTSTPPRLANAVCPGARVVLLAEDRTVLATAEYEREDHSRASTPGGDSSESEPAPTVADAVPAIVDDADDWDCEEEFPDGPASPAAAAAPAALAVLLPGRPPLTIPFPARTQSRLVVVPGEAAAGGTSGAAAEGEPRYCVVVEREDSYDGYSVTVRSPLQLRNETSYALEVSCRRSEAIAAGAAPRPPAEGEEVAGVTGVAGNPFEDRLRLAVVAPQDVYNVPLMVAYHCRLYLVPVNHENGPYRAEPSSSLWWRELAAGGASGAGGAGRDLQCRATPDGDHSVFVMRLVATEGVSHSLVSRAIPNLTVCVRAPLRVLNALPLPVELTATAAATSKEEDKRGNSTAAGAPVVHWSSRLEPGERAHTHRLPRSARVAVSLRYRAANWRGEFLLTPETTEEVIKMRPEGESSAAEGAGGPGVVARVSRAAPAQLVLFAPYWLINKTGLPVHFRGRGTDECIELTSEPALWRPRARSLRRGSAAAEARVHESEWARLPLGAPLAPALLVCRHPRRAQRYRLVLSVRPSALCPRWSRIAMLSPHAVVANRTKRPLRYMEADEAADLWLELAAGATAPLWPRTDSMLLHCRARHAKASPPFPIDRPHTTLLRCDRNSAVTVEVSCGPMGVVVAFRAPRPGDAAARIRNYTALHLKIEQRYPGAPVTLLAPGQTMLYAWDDPATERTLLWSAYGGRGREFVAELGRDGCGGELVGRAGAGPPRAPPASKLADTLKRLRSAPPDLAAEPAPAPPRPDEYVHWFSYTEGTQRVLALAQGEAARRRAARLAARRAAGELHVALAAAGLSLCAGGDELAYVSVAGSPPRWEALVRRRWRALSAAAAARLEALRRAGRRRAPLPDGLTVDLERMEMTRPFFAALRRCGAAPALAVAARRGGGLTLLAARLHRLQVDDTRAEAMFPVALHPAAAAAPRARPRPAARLAALYAHPPREPDTVKYLKLVVVPHCVNLDRGLGAAALAAWAAAGRRRGRPAGRLRTDLAVVHRPLGGGAGGPGDRGGPRLEFAHVGPLQVRLRLSRPPSPPPARPPTAMLEYLLHEWDAAPPDVKEVLIRLSYVEARPGDDPAMLWAALQAQYCAQALGAVHSALGRALPRSRRWPLVPLGPDMDRYYDPELGVVWSGGFRAHSSAAGATGAGAGAGARDVEDPAAVPAPATALDAVLALLSHPAYDDQFAHIIQRYRAASPGGDGGDGAGLADSEAAAAALLAARLLPEPARRRLPRAVHPTEGVQSYSSHTALGRAAVASLGPNLGCYLAHARLAGGGGGGGGGRALFITTRAVAEAHGAGARWQALWAAPLERVIAVEDDEENERLLIDVRQDELSHAFAWDRRAVAATGAARGWLASRLKDALALAREDQRLPEQDH